MMWDAHHLPRKMNEQVLSRAFFARDALTVARELLGKTLLHGLAGGIIVEVTSADGYFYFTFMQDFSDDIYFREFQRELEELGVPMEYLGCGPIMAPKIQLP